MDAVYPYTKSAVERRKDRKNEKMRAKFGFFNENAYLCKNNY